MVVRGWSLGWVGVGDGFQGGSGFGGFHFFHCLRCSGGSLISIRKGGFKVGEGLALEVFPFVVCRFLVLCFLYSCTLAVHRLDRYE